MLVRPHVVCHHLSVCRTMSATCTVTEKCLWKKSIKVALFTLGHVITTFYFRHKNPFNMEFSLKEHLAQQDKTIQLCCQNIKNKHFIFPLPMLKMLKWKTWRTDVWRNTCVFDWLKIICLVKGSILMKKRKLCGLVLNYWVHATVICWIIRHYFRIILH